MNGKFESNSNNYDEPNLKSVSLGFWPESKRSPGERSDTRDSLERAPAYRCAHAGYNSRLRSIRNHRLAIELRRQLVKFNQRLVADRAVHDFAPLLP